MLVRRINFRILGTKGLREEFKVKVLSLSTSLDSLYYEAYKFLVSRPFHFSQVPLYTPGWRRAL